ncbi:hypothetical protein CAP39_09010 [Sphingomonas sp. IBVSS1]|nr:hypothetical protein CAP39_09010 [Sphingomonas sp. IBVSS1]
MPRPNKAIWLALLACAPLRAQAPDARAPDAAARPPAVPYAATNAPKIATVTPVKDRVLVIGALSKRTGQSRSFTLKPGQYVEFAGIRITARTCETTPPWERPKLSGAFLQVDEKLGNSPLRRVFSGWLYAESPSLNVMEHPRYDVWLKSCTMRFPDGPALGPSPSSSTKKSPEPTSAAASLAR